MSSVPWKSHARLWCILCIVQGSLAPVARQKWTSVQLFFFFFFFFAVTRNVVSYIFIVLQFSSDVKDSFDVIICSHANKLTLHALIYTDCSGNCYSILLLRVWTKDNRKHKHSNHTRVLLCSFICHRTKHKHLFFFSLH